MNLQHKIKSLKKGKKSDPFEDRSFVCINEFKWDYFKLMKTPIPFVLKMTDKWSDIQKEQEKQTKKKR